MTKQSTNILLGIGNPLRGDDGAGSFIAQNFRHCCWISLDGKSAPENFTSSIKKIQPKLLVIVDAAWMNLDAGNFQIIPYDKIISLQLTTHSMPIHFLIEYLVPYCQKVMLIGIQPLSTKLGESLSKPVLESCYLIMNLLKENRIGEIKQLSPN
jgi:hydrogenase 3 maturation protease